MKKRVIFLGILLLTWRLSPITNPYSIYSLAVEASDSNNFDMKNFLGPSWYFLPESATKEKLKENFRAKFGTLPTAIAIDHSILIQLCNRDELCPRPAVSELQYKKLQQKLNDTQAQCSKDKLSLRHELDACISFHAGDTHETCQNAKIFEEKIGKTLEQVKKECAEQQTDLAHKLQTEFSQNLELVKDGYKRIYMANLAYAEAVQKLNEAYEILQLEKPKGNSQAIIHAINDAYKAYQDALTKLDDLHKTLTNVGINIGISIPNGSAIAKSIEISAKAEKLNLKPM